MQQNKLINLTRIFMVCFVLFFTKPLFSTPEAQLLIARLIGKWHCIRVFLIKIDYENYAFSSSKQNRFNKIKKYKNVTYFDIDKNDDSTKLIQVINDHQLLILNQSIQKGQFDLDVLPIYTDESFRDFLTNVKNGYKNIIQEKRSTTKDIEYVAASTRLVKLLNGESVTDEPSTSSSVEFYDLFTQYESNSLRWELIECDSVERVNKEIQTVKNSQAKEAFSKLNIIFDDDVSNYLHQE